MVRWVVRSPKQWYTSGMGLTAGANNDRLRHGGMVQILVAEGSDRPEVLL